MSDRLEDAEHAIKACEAMLIVVYKALLQKGILVPAELANMMNLGATAMQELACRPDLTDADLRHIDAQLELIGRVRQHCEV